MLGETTGTYTQGCVFNGLPIVFETFLFFPDRLHAQSQTHYDYHQIKPLLMYIQTILSTMYSRYIKYLVRKLWLSPFQLPLVFLISSLVPPISSPVVSHQIHTYICGRVRKHYGTFHVKTMQKNRCR